MWPWPTCFCTTTLQTVILCKCSKWLLTLSPDGASSHPRGSSVNHGGSGGHSYRASGSRACGGRSGSGHRGGESKTTRIRTVLNEKQLHTLRTCYSANSRPDALMKEQLVEMTGLSPRVIRVWFQNKRCKDKKRSLALKQLHQQQQNKVQHPHAVLHDCKTQAYKLRVKDNDAV